MKEFLAMAALMSNLNIILMATAWGPRHGGINAFNCDFAKGLSEALGSLGRVFCAVLAPSRDDSDDARHRGVTLIPLKNKGQAEKFDTAWTYEIVEWLKENEGISTVSWWVGHDVISGDAAIRGPGTPAGGRAALIHHMSYIAYQGVKHDDAVDADAKDCTQKALFGSKDAKLFAVGPLLRDSCRRLAGDNRTVTMLAPGFPSLPDSRPDPNRIVAVSFGRMDAASDRIKQGQLSVAGFGAALKTAHDSGFCPPVLEDPRFSLIGLPDSVGQEAVAARTLMEKHAGRVVNVLPLPYDENRDRLFGRLAEANMAFMLSWHEGFGLTGWEAIAAELPLIVSEQSGLYKLLNETLSGAANGYVRPIKIEGKRGNRGGANFSANDLKNVSQAIIFIANDLLGAQKKAKELKKQLMQKLTCTWEHTGQQFLDGLEINYEEASSAQKSRTQGDSTLGKNAGGYQNVTKTILLTGATKKLEEIDGNKKIKRQDHCDVRLDKLKNSIIECLAKSAKSMAAIAEQLNIYEAALSGKLEERANLLCQTLLSTHFDNALNALNNARRKISGASDNDHQVIADVTAWLLPWLHTEALGIDRTTWEYKDIGEILSFPAEIPSFADIVMAGLDIRPIEFDMSTPNARWVRSPLSLNLDIPEIGIDAGDHIPVKAENAIRMALAKAVGVPEIKLGQGPEVIDQSIDECLDYFLDEEWKRHYVICNRFTNKESQEQHRTLMSNVAERYRKLAVIDIEIINCGHQRIFETIRSLIRSKGDQK